MGNDLPNHNGNNLIRDVACSLESHNDCLPQICEITALSSDVTQAQVRVGLVTAIAGLAISSLFAVGVLFVWMYHAFRGEPMPDIPWIINSIVGAAFVSGAVTAFKIPKKAKVE